MSNFCHHVTNNHSFLLIFTEYLHIRTPFEVQKEAVRSNSLSTLLQNTPGLQAIRYSMRPYKEQEALTNVPLYAVVSFPIIEESGYLNGSSHNLFSISSIVGIVPSTFSG